jgi:hypothetical protein
MFCPKHILSADHWFPVHKVEECGADKIQKEKEKIIVAVAIKPTKKVKHKSSMYQDIEKTCVCGKGFIWTSGEQLFMNRLYEEGKIKEIVEPKRCPDCRKKKKERYEQRQNSGQREF